MSAALISVQDTSQIDDLPSYTKTFDAEARKKLRMVCKTSACSPECETVTA